MFYKSSIAGIAAAGVLGLLAMGPLSNAARAQQHHSSGSSMHMSGPSGSMGSGGQTFAAPAHNFSNPQNFSQGQGFNQVLPGNNFPHNNPTQGNSSQFQQGFAKQPGNFTQQGNLGANANVNGMHHDHNHGYWNPYWGWGLGWGPSLGWGYPYGYNNYGYDPNVNGPYITAYPSDPTQVQPTPMPQTNYAPSGNSLGSAVDAFKRGDYRGAFNLAQQVSTTETQNPAPHQLMSLALFATGDYRGASNEMHSALNLAPPMDWPMIYNFYGNDKPFTDQLRALEQFVGTNPQSFDGRFLLGFLYGATGNRPQAIAQLQEATKFNSGDQMTTRLLNSLQNQGPGSGNSQSAPPPPNQPQ